MTVQVLDPLQEPAGTLRRPSPRLGHYDNDKLTSVRAA